MATAHVNVGATRHARMGCFVWRGGVPHSTGAAGDKACANYMRVGGTLTTVECTVHMMQALFPDPARCCAGNKRVATGQNLAPASAARDPGREHVDA